MTKLDRGLYTSDRLLSSGFASRGSLMLRAALCDTNRSTSKTVSNEFGTSVVEAHKQAKLMQQSQTKPSQKRKKYKVLFREPPVTKQYEYEPTYLAEQGVVDKIAHKTPSSENERPKLANQNSLSENNPVINPGHIPMEDNDEDVFMMASSSFSGHELSNMDMEIKSMKKVYKRPRECIVDDDKEDSKNNSQEEGLFSSPKIAKIAPYYDEQFKIVPDIKFTDKCKKPAFVSQRASHQKLNQLFEALKSETRSATPELLHYEKASESQMDPESLENTGEDVVSSHVKYFGFGWFTNGLNFLSNQMNKLIF